MQATVLSLHNFAHLSLPDPPSSEPDYTSASGTPPRRLPDHPPTHPPALWAGADVPSLCTGEDLGRHEQKETSRVTKSGVCRADSGPRSLQVDLTRSAQGFGFFFSQISHQHGDSISCDIKARVSCFCKCHKSGGWGHRATIGGNRKQLPEQMQNRLPRSRRGPRAPGAAWPWTHRRLRPLSQSTPLIHHLVREKLRPQEAACPGLHGQLAAEQG